MLRTVIIPLRLSRRNTRAQGLFDEAFAAINVPAVDVLGFPLIAAMCS
ncbi:hypothetical protein [Methylobacterium aerolatum]|uniref:Uncharacterized protein n=1 Tax=Methylobacterium aerolatum TaxID=418708 RepID=A0ABU0HXM1_9HYPH|nr:hypothetical protein [Methylobacterium aerolatum]MDQ0447093.1 hypothetical protein [Methylobacterium aerolatum]